MMAKSQPFVSYIQQSDEFLARADTIYRPLDASKKETRLIRILPGELDNEVVRLELQVVSLDDDPYYETISYSWENVGCFRIVFLQDVPFKVTLNQYYALMRFRRPDEVRVLWMDCVCINQADLAERGHQIRMMADVYLKAHALMVWLGEDFDAHSRYQLEDRSEVEIDEDNENELIFDRYRNLAGMGYEMSYPEDESEEDEGPMELDFELMRTGYKITVAFYALTVLSRTTKSRPLPLKALGRKENAFAWYRALRMLRGVLCSAWWTRAWVLQELILSLSAHGRVYVNLGPRSVPFSDFSKLAYLCNLQTTPGIATAVLALINDDGIMKSVHFNHEYVNRYRSNILGWLECFMATMYLDATDSHDSVYCFFGLLRPDEICMDVDYTRSVRETFSLATWAALRSTGPQRWRSLLLPAHSMPHDPYGLPSWCLNWKRHDMFDFMSVPTVYLTDFFPSGPDAPFDLTTSSDAAAGHLFVRAVEIDTIDAFQGVRSPTAHDEILQIYRSFLDAEGIQLDPDDWRRLMFLDTQFRNEQGKGRLDRVSLDLIASWEAHIADCNEWTCRKHDKVRDAFEECSFRRTMFVCESRNPGIGNEHVRQGDKVFRIMGFEGIYVLRPVPPEVYSAKSSLSGLEAETYQVVCTGFVTHWRNALDSIGKEKTICLV